VERDDDEGRCLAVGGRLPGSFGAKYRIWDDWRGFTELTFDLWVPADAPGDLDIFPYIKDKQYWWFQAAPLHDPQTGTRARGLQRGQWQTFTLDISEDSTAWEAAGHQRSWNRVLFYPREFGVRFFGTKEWSGTVRLDNLRLTGNEPPLGPMQHGAPGSHRGQLELGQNTDTLAVYEKFEATFEVKRNYENPFDPAVVNVEGHFLTPDGDRLVVPGFWYQDYRRTKTEEGYEKLLPVGEPVWKVRFSASQPGTYRYFVKIQDAWGEERSAERTFTVVDDPDQPGLVRISQQHPRFFEFENGDFFFPIGLNMRDGGDQAEAQKGTFDFDYFFTRFEEEGLNFVRSWMCAWWAGIEWGDEYHSRFDDVGRYSMYNAWRLDYMMDLAREHDIYIELTLNSHGQLRRDKFDAEWEYNPYSVKNGGFVASPAMFMSSQRATEMMKQRLRYIVARWGYSPMLMSWDLVNEVDLSEGYDRAEAAAWHKEMAEYIREIDIHDHVITTHICIFWGYGGELWQLDEIEYTQADAYWDRHIKCMNRGWNDREQYDKPFMFIEYGPQTVALPISAQQWQRNFRTGQWISYMIPSAAPGQFWYHLAWDEYRLYEYQQGLFAFNQGEDRRGLNLKRMTASAATERDLDIDIQAMGNGTHAYFYVLNYDNMLHPRPDDVPDERRIRTGHVTLEGMEPGDYVVEYWDTIEGEIIDTARATTDGELLKLTLPEFAQEIAAKVRPAG
ncbi:MAG: DUF5060 domain-containing protein, partial [Armatimonadota bacterium]